MILTNPGHRSHASPPCRRDRTSAPQFSVFGGVRQTSPPTWDTTHVDRLLGVSR
jgi:hypothetical protein